MKILRFLRSLKDNELVRATLTVASLGLVVKVVALVKEMVVAAHFGVSREMDIFTLALSVVSLPVSLIAGNLNVAYLPVYVGLRSQDCYRDARALHSAMLRRLLLGMMILASLIGLLAPFWIPRMVPAWSLVDQARLRWLVILMLVTLPLGGAVSQLASTLQGQRHFVGPALSPVWNSLAIMGILLFPLQWGAFQLGTGIVLGGIFELGTLFWLLHRLDPGLPAACKAPPESIRSVLRLYLPAVGSGLFMSSTTLVDSAISALLPPGAVSTLAYASRVPGVVLALTGGALVATLFPSFSYVAELGQWRRLRSQATRAVVASLVGSAIMTAILYMLSPWLVKLLFHRGSFGLDEVNSVASVQSIYLLQIPFYIGCIIIVRVIFALKQHRINLYGTIINGVLNFGLDLAFLPSMGVRGIALSTVCVYFVSFVFLAIAAHRLIRVREAAEAQP
jgi:putative peptidoglycan lipid II flippase